MKHPCNSFDGTRLRGPYGILVWKIPLHTPWATLGEVDAFTVVEVMDRRQRSASPFLEIFSRATGGVLCHKKDELRPLEENKTRYLYDFRF
jgi:hypothetical protein